MIEQDVTEVGITTYAIWVSAIQVFQTQQKCKALLQAKLGFKNVSQPMGIVGHGFWHFWLPTGDEDNFVDLYFSINAEVIENVSGEVEHFSS